MVNKLVRTQTANHLASQLTTVEEAREQLDNATAQHDTITQDAIHTVAEARGWEVTTTDD